MEKNRILVVDDNINMCITLQDILLDDGYDVLISDNGQEALELIEQQEPHLIITDMRMPNIDGLELLQIVKGKHPKIEIIIMTALGEVDSYLKAMKIGAFEYITKPINPKILKSIISKILK
ncbi:MAG: response regulator [bacterium]|nr:response regulator [bacterium]